MSYWQDRMASAQTKLTTKTYKEIEKQTAKYYQSAMKKTIADFVNTYDRVQKGLKDDIQPTPADLYKLDKYWHSQAQMREVLQKLGEKQIVALSNAFEANFFDIYYSIALPGMEAFSSIDKTIVQQLINQIWVADGKTWSDRIWDNVEQLAEMLNEQLLDCVINGKDTNQLKMMLQDRFNVSYSNADSLVRTELAHIQTQASQQRYTDYGIDMVEVWADEDERRCDICGKLHQKRFPVGSQMPIPAHPRCRCCIVPVID